MFAWFRKWRRRKSPVVQVQTHEFSFPPTDASLFDSRILECDPQQSVAFWTTNIPHFLNVKIEENGTLAVTRVGAAEEWVEATVRVVEFAKGNKQMIRGALELIAVVALLALLIVCLGCPQKPKPWLERYQEQMSELTPGTWTPAWDSTQEGTE